MHVLALAFGSVQHCGLLGAVAVQVRKDHRVRLGAAPGIFQLKRLAQIGVQSRLHGALPLGRARRAQKLFHIFAAQGNAVAAAQQHAAQQRRAQAHPVSQHKALPPRQISVFQYGMMPRSGLSKTAPAAVLHGSMFSKPCAPAQGRVQRTRAAAAAAALRLLYHKNMKKRLQTV